MEEEETKQEEDKGKEGDRYFGRNNRGVGRCRDRSSKDEELRGRY